MGEHACKYGAHGHGEGGSPGGGVEFFDDEQRRTESRPGPLSSPTDALDRTERQRSAESSRPIPLVVVTEDSPDPSVKRDDGIIAALRSGDAKVFRSIVSELNPGLLRLARTYVSPALAEVVVQENWIAVVRSIHSFEERSSLKTWIYQIMLNKVRSLATREAKIIPFAALGHAGNPDAPSVDPDRLVDAERGPGHWGEPPPMWDAPADEVERAELLEMIDAAIRRLPAAQREVVELRDVQGWSANEVCNTLGISSVNQRVLLHRGRAAIRARLEEYLTND
jgi:RNA polymerase sigma-70 factor (ECF subfamily)